MLASFIGAALGSIAGGVILTYWPSRIKDDKPSMDPAPYMKKAKPVYKKKPVANDDFKAWMIENDREI